MHPSPTVTAAIGLWLTAIPRTWAQEVDPDLHRVLNERSWASVIVMLRSAAAEPSFDESIPAVRVAQQRVLDRLRPKDFRLSHRWTTIRGFAGRVSRSGLKTLLDHPDVARVDLDQRISAHLAQSVPLIRADQVHALGVTGAGVAVAVLDTGVDSTHEDLADSVIAEQCFCCCGDGTDEQSGPGAAKDRNGHGTHVTGIIASKGTIAPRGVAPGASIVAVKILDDDGIGSLALVISGLDWIIANRPDVRVVNMSLGSFALSPGYCDDIFPGRTFRDAVNTLTNRGTIVIASSGNNGSSSEMSAPACVRNTVSVGAVTDSDEGPFSCDGSVGADLVTCFTNVNDTLDLLAPGAVITSTGIGRARTLSLAGTSMAAPHVAGLAALLLEVRPALTPSQLQAALSATGVPIFEPRTGLTFPRVDALGALDAVTHQADLSVTMTDGRTTASPGNSLAYTIAVLNNGPNAVDAATVTDAVPPGLTGVTWSCVGSGGGTCSSSGSGSINDAVDLPAGASVTYTLNGTVSASPRSVRNTVTAAVPAGMSDPVLANNSATDDDVLLCFGETIVIPDGRKSGATIAGGATAWFGASLGIGRSYSLELRGASDITEPPGTLTLFAGDDGCSGASTLAVTDTAEVDPAVSGGGVRISFTATGESNFFRARLVNPSGSSIPFTFALSDTTLFSPAWSTNAAFNTYYSLQNTTGRTVHGALSLLDTTGAVLGSTLVSIPAGQTVSANASALGIPANRVGTARFIHDGPPAAIVAEAAIAIFSITPHYVQPVKFTAVREAR